MPSKRTIRPAARSVRARRPQDLRLPGEKRRSGKDRHEPRARQVRRPSQVSGLHGVQGKREHLPLRPRRALPGSRSRAADATPGARTAGSGCWGCRGPAEDANVEQMKEIMKKNGFSEETMLDRLECFGGFAKHADDLRKKKCTTREHGEMNTKNITNGSDHGILNQLLVASVNRLHRVTSVDTDSRKESI